MSDGRRRLWLLLVLCSVPLALAAAPVRAAGRAPASAVPSSASQRVAAVRADPRLAEAARLRAAAASGSVAAVVREQATTLPAARSPLPVVGLPSPLQSLQPDLERRLPQPLADAIVAVMRADVVGDAAVRAATPDAWRPQVLAALHQLLRDPQAFVSEGPGNRPQLSPRFIALSAHVDIGLMAEAAGAMAAAVDELRAVAAASPTGDWLAAQRRAHRGQQAASECDVYGVAPYICVGGTGDNTYTTDYWVQVDLGGNDTYANTAGAATLCGQSLLAGVVDPCAALVVDLDGGDTFAPLTPDTAPQSFCWTYICQQGAGLDSIGMLVDQGGGNTYTSVGVPSTDECSFGSCALDFAQGMGFFGVGVLADLGGSSTFSASLPAHEPGSTEDTWGQVWAQGSSGFGMGLLLHTGSGHDTYTISGYASGVVGPTGICCGPTNSFEGQGQASGGSGVLLDDGGGNQYVESVIPSPGAADRTSYSPYGESAGASLDWVQGMTPGVGFAALLGGSGGDTYSVDVAARFGASANAQGEDALLDDTGGGNRVSLSVATDAAISHDCTCADSRQDMFGPYMGFAVASGQGDGSGGLLYMGGGDNRFSASAHSGIDVSATNDQPGASAEATARGSRTGLSVQGSTLGTLFDEGGGNTFAMQVSVHATATAKAAADASGQRAAIAWAVPVYTTADGQGGSDGALINLGSGNRYSETISRDLAASPDPGGHTDSSFTDAYTQGAIGGVVVDPSNDAPDTFHADAPSIFDVCQGSHGQAPAWVDGTSNGSTSGGCDASGGGGTVGSSVPAGDATRIEGLTFAPIADTDHPDVIAQLQLVDSQGRPLTGRTVSLYPQTLCGASTTGTPDWCDLRHTSTDVSTTTDGVAGGVVNFSLRSGEALPECLRVVAMYFGEAGVHQPAEQSTEAGSGCTPPPSLPEAPWSPLMLAAGLTVAGVGALLSRRRRATRP